MTLNQTENMVTALLTFSFAVLGLTFLLGANPEVSPQIMTKIQ